MTPIRLLIIDDNPIDIETHQRFLNQDKNSQYKLLKTNTGEEGIKILDSLTPDCILLDHRLPDMDGLEFLQHVNKNKKFSTIPIIFITGHGDEMLAVSAMKNGAVDYLIKGRLTEQLLIRTIQHAIEKKQSETKLHEHLTLMDTLINTIPNPIFYKDKNGKYQGCNESFEVYLGKSKNEIIGKTAYDISPKKLAQKYNEMDQELLCRGGVQIYEAPVRFKDDSIRHVLFYKATVNNIHGDVDGLVGVMVDITDRKRVEEKVQYLALHDSLTQLPNRNLFFDRLDHAISRAKRHNQFVGLLYIDLDGFKPVNDTHGHDVGDLVLKEVSKRLKITIRESDTAARLGGDEFAIILQDIKEKSYIETITQKLIQAIAEPIQVINIQCEIGASIGISIYPDDATDANMLVKKADTAMYQVKKRRKNNYIFFDNLRHSPITDYPKKEN